MNCNSETEEETIAVNKKRARRVSFAENTSVHIFDRDEETESPTDPLAISTDVNPTELGLFNDELGFRRNSIDPKDILRNDDEEEEEDDDDDDDMDARPSFFRPMESPSSGSGFGSATSNDEDNFFGPVSASFIRPGRLSDSATYDDNHEVTMDSTAFSMNFRSLAKSDSGGDLLTSTGVHLTFDEKTPTQDCIPSNEGSTMVLTVAKRPNPQSSPPTAKLRRNSDSNDMSLVGEISRQYDYGGLSPGLDKLLAQTSKDLHASDETGYIESLKNIKSGISLTKEHGLAHSIVDGDEEYKEMVRSSTSHGGISPTEVVSIEQNISATGCGTLSSLETKHHELGGSTLQVWNSPLISSINSLSPKQRQIVDDSLNLSKSPWHMTPSLKQASYFVGSDDRMHKNSASSIQKSISKLELLQASPFSVAVSAKISSSNFRPLHYLPRTPLGSALKSKSTYVKDADGDRTESFIQEKGDRKQDKKIETPKDIRCIVPAKGLRSALKSGRSPYNVSAANPYADQQKKESGLVTLLPQSFCPPEQSEQHVLSSDDPSEVKLVTGGTDASIIGVTLECMEGKRVIGTPHNSTSPVCRKIDGMSSTLPNYLGTQSQEKSDLRGDGASACFLAATVDNKEPLSHHGRVESSSPIVHNNHCRGSPVAENLNDGDIYHAENNQGNCGTIKKSPIPLEHRVSHIFQYKTPNGDSETEREQINARNDLVDEGEHVSFSQKSANDPSIRKNLGTLFAQSPGNEEKNVIHSDSIYPISILGRQSPSSNQVTTVVGSYTRKRSNEEITPQDESTKAKKSPKLCIGGCDPDVSKCSVSPGSTGGNVLKHWVDIQSKISEITKNLLSLPADELSLQSIDVLEDIVVGLLRKQKYQMLRADMQSQKTNHPLSNHHHIRVVEAKSHLHKLIEEKAKLQLKRVKRDISLKKAQIMRSGVQECQMLRSDHSVLHPQKALNVQADIHPQRFSDRQSSQDKVTALEEVLEDLERSVTKLTESFLVRCKIKEKLDSAETVVLVNDYLTKRACCRFSRLDMQLWDIVHLENRNGHSNILLNYLGFITQRVNVVFRPVSIVSVSYELHNMNIIKNLPGVDARTAFAYVFDAEPTRKYVSSRSVAEETQISSLLLGSMLDVVEEVQLARLELRNLIQCTFCSESVEQLDLQLYFLNLKSGKRATFTFDLSCLKRGVYPSEIIPSIMKAPADEQQKFCSKQILSEVRAAVQSLRVGYLRIIRACRCISQAIEASNS
ncbi:uncharacterized protein LOC108219029 isoform X2 [Daucus carota subsp. sativus]|uniref:uncharacterized protein LOC108219029 isoform X2 n=1 Tax=Daucus carota subsp. sativus TaxID=79200 RepID=UPI0007F0190C|nr:PREDICTED: uncharacterized protein LOC108219029 isoform X2 [Daucus carota subsp. sativus]